MDRAVFVRHSELLLTACVPYMCESLVRYRADIDRVAEDMSLVNREVEYDRAVASVLVRHREPVDTCRTQRVGRVFRQTVLHPLVNP